VPDVNEFQQRIGVGQTCHAIGRTGPTRKRLVTVEEGPRRGSVGGFHLDHKDGRTDATVFAPSINVTAKAQEI